MDIFNRTKLLIGEENLKKLHMSNILVFGVGGVGGYVIEALVRAGIENITIVDNDTISETNINRQIIATTENVGKYKVDEMKNRILSINPYTKVKAIKEFYTEESNILNNTYDYVIDAIDTVSSKIAIIKKCKELQIPIISCMGTGNKLNPKNFKIADISKTKVCPLAKVIRKELKKLGIEKVKVLYSEEEPIKTYEKEENRKVPASISFVPSVAGLIIASEVVNDLITI